MESNKEPAKPSRKRHAPCDRRAEFRFYEELNDFLPKGRKKRAFSHRFFGTPSVKDVIESLGVPHTEVDLVLCDGVSVDFDRRLEGGERVAVYPTFESLDIADVTRLRPRPLRQLKFVLDVHLSRLARYLRLAGFDAVCDACFDDATIVRISIQQQRVALSRDKALLKHGRLTHAYWIRTVDPKEQFAEVVRRFNLKNLARPFTRCLVCNTRLEDISAADAAGLVPTRIGQQYSEFARCKTCGKVYWPGTHVEQMRGLLRDALGQGDRGHRKSCT